MCDSTGVGFKAFAYLTLAVATIFSMRISLVVCFSVFVICVLSLSLLSGLKTRSESDRLLVPSHAVFSSFADNAC